MSAALKKVTSFFTRSFWRTMTKSLKATATKPCTPVRKRFLDLFKPTIVLGKRGRDTESDKSEGLADAAKDVQRSSPITLKRSTSVALLNEDEDIEETIIVTALDTIPFCCHEDLLTMTRPQLLAVADALNAKLPSALRIDVKPSSTDGFVRSAIELIVGIKRAVPAAPKAMKLGLSPVADSDGSVSPPTSPLAMKNQRRREYQVNPRLAVLEEEDEGTVIMTVARPMKRSVSVQTAGPVTKKRRMSAQAAIPARRMKSARDVSRNPATMARAKSQRIPTSQISPPRSSRVLRSHSQKLSSEIAAMKMDTAFITVQRPRYRFHSTSKGHGKIPAPTREPGRFEEGPSSTQRSHIRSGTPEGTDQEIVSTSSSNSTNEGSPWPPTARVDPKYGTQYWIGGKGKEEPEMAPSSDVGVDGGEEVTLGLREMTMAPNGSDAVMRG